MNKNRALTAFTTVSIPLVSTKLGIEVGEFLRPVADFLAGDTVTNGREAPGLFGTIGFIGGLALSNVYLGRRTGRDIVQRIADRIVSHLPVSEIVIQVRVDPSTDYLKDNIDEELWKLIDDENRNKH